jgi:hypothetical protein
MHYVIQQELAQGHQAALLREAEAHRLALQARGETRRPTRVRVFVEQLRRRRPEQRPAPAV